MNPNGTAGGGPQRDLSRRIDVRNIVDLVTKHRTPSRQVVVGSSPAPQHPMWDTFREMGFETTHLHKVLQASGKSTEEAVDDVIHAAMLRDAGRQYPQSRTMILLTGDGNNNSHRTSFPEVSDAAALAMIPNLTVQ